MHSSGSVLLAVVACASGEWIFSWPYGDDGSCSCVDSAIGSYQNFTTESQCLEAFASSDLEYCVYDNDGLSEDQCSSAVSVAEGVLNGDCASMCTAVVARVLPLADFLQSCKFEFVIPFDDSVTVLPDSCYSNYVYGYSDYDVTNLVQAQPFRIFPDVPTPPRCQELCQRTPDCVFFSWRAIADDTSDLNAVQNAPLTCILYDDTYMDQVFSVQVDETLPTTSAYCNADMLGDCHVKPWEQTSDFPLLTDYNCLSCGCETKCAWLSATHISGPAFCAAPTGRDECHYARPTWTSTLPPCEDISTTESITDAGTAETDTALETTTHAAGTAETDTAVTHSTECICEPETTTTQAVCVCPPQEAEKELLSATEPVVGTMMMHREPATEPDSTTAVALETTTDVGLSETTTTIQLSETQVVFSQTTETETPASKETSASAVIQK